MIYTAWANYFATGEGNTVMVLITPVHSDEVNVEEVLKKRFSELFGEYMAIGMEFKKGLYFDFPGNGYVLSQGIRNNYKTMERSVIPYNEYYASFHVNYS